MKIAIIGCGYVGTVIARQWREKFGFVITATTTTPERVPELETVADRVRVVAGNDAEGLQRVLTDQDVVLVTVGAKGGDYQTAYLGTAKTLAALLPQMPTVKQVIYTSSCAVYGDQQGDWVDETVAITPATPKAQILYDTEQVLLGLSNSRLKVCVLRLGGIYGPGRTLFQIYRRSAGKTRGGTGNEPSNWIHLDDIVGGIEFTRHQQLQGIYNLVDDDKITTRELLEQLFAYYQLPPVTWDLTQPSGRGYHARLSNAKIKQAGYQFIYPYRQIAQ